MKKEVLLITKEGVVLFMKYHLDEDNILYCKEPSLRKVHGTQYKNLIMQRDSIKNCDTFYLIAEL